MKTSTKIAIVVGGIAAAYMLTKKNGPRQMEGLGGRWSRAVHSVSNAVSSASRGVASGFKAVVQAASSAAKDLASAAKQVARVAAGPVRVLRKATKPVVRKTKKVTRKTLKVTHLYPVVTAVRKASRDGRMMWKVVVLKKKPGEASDEPLEQCACISCDIPANDWIPASECDPRCTQDGVKGRLVPLSVYERLAKEMQSPQNNPVYQDENGKTITKAEYDALMRKNTTEYFDANGVPIDEVEYKRLLALARMPTEYWQDANGKSITKAEYERQQTKLKEAATPAPAPLPPTPAGTAPPSPVPPTAPKEAVLFSPTPAQIDAAQPAKSNAPLLVGGGIAAAAVAALALGNN